MRSLATLLVLAILAGTAAGAGLESAYTELRAKEDCAVFAAPAEGEAGDWSNAICSGWRGYPVLIQYGDLRESVHYGFPPAGDLAPVWESFSAFNRTGPTIEWRIWREGGRQTPIAAIHRWFVGGGEGAAPVEVLVIEKVGQIGERQGCVVGYVVASGNGGANEKARAIADARARDFSCGADEPSVDQGSVPLPSATRAW